MRWDRLFADLEAQLEAADRADLSAEIADRTRRDVALVALAHRLSSARGARLELRVEGAGVVSGALRRVGQGWLLLDTGSSPDAFVCTSAILAARGLPATAPPPGPEDDVAGRLDVGYILRGIARDRSPVVIVLRDGSQLTGTIDRVGADFVDLAEHPEGEPRRARTVRAVRMVAAAGLAIVRPL